MKRSVPGEVAVSVTQASSREALLVLAAKEHRNVGQEPGPRGGAGHAHEERRQEDRGKKSTAKMAAVKKPSKASGES